MKYTEDELDQMASEGEDLRNEGKTAEALLKLLPAAEHGNVCAMISLAGVYMDMGDTELELKWLLEAFKADPGCGVDETIDSIILADDANEEYVRLAASYGYYNAV